MLRSEIRATNMPFLQWKARFQWLPLLTMEMSHRYGIIDTNERENVERLRQQSLEGY